MRAMISLGGVLPGARRSRAAWLASRCSTSFTGAGTPCPFGEHRLGVLGLDRQEEDIAVAQFEFAGLAHRGHRQRHLAVRGDQPEAVRAERVQMRPAGHQHDLVPRFEQPGADCPAHRAGPDDDVAHFTYSDRLAPSPPAPHPLIFPGRAGRRRATRGQDDGTP
jgi:hypothetical protein